MSTRWIDYWESYGIPHDDKSKDYIESDDLIVKGKFNFMNKNFKLSGKTRFNTAEGQLSTSSDYTLTHTLSPVTSYMVIHKPNNVTLDGNFKLWSQDKTLLSLYSNVKLSQSAKSRELPSKLHLRVHHEDNKIFGLGFEGLDPLSGCPAPKHLSAWGLFGAPLGNGFKAFGGSYLGFGLGYNTILYHKYLLGLKHQNLTAHLEVVVNRVPTKVTGTDGKESLTFTNDKNVSLKFDGNANRDLKVGGDFVYNLENKSFDAKLYGQYSVDSATFVKAKVQTDNSLSLSLTHHYKGLGLFGFTSRFEFVSPKAVEGEKTPALRHFKTKFGVYTEFNENF